MSTWIDKTDIEEAINYYKGICKNEDEAYENAAESLGMSPDRMLEMIEE